MASHCIPHLQGSHHFVKLHEPPLHCGSISNYWPNEMLILPVVSNDFWPILNSNKKVPWICFLSNIIFVSSVQSLSCVLTICVLTPWTLAHQASLSITNSWGFITLVSIKSVMPSNHLILCRPLFCVQSSQNQGLFQWVSSLHQVANVVKLQLQHQSFQRIFRTDFI